MSSSTTSRPPRLTSDQVSAFREHGYLLYQAPVFDGPTFDAHADGWPTGH